MRRFYRALTYATRGRPHELTPAEARIWAALERSGESGVTDDEFIAETSLNEGAIQSALGAMEARGEIRQEGD